MCGSVVRLGVMSYLGEMNGFRVPRPLVCNTLGEMNGLGLTDPCGGPSAHGVERGAPPAAPGVLGGGHWEGTQAGP